MRTWLAIGVVMAALFGIARLAWPGCAEDCYRAPCEVSEQCPPGCECYSGRCQ